MTKNIKFYDKDFIIAAPENSDVWEAIENYDLICPHCLRKIPNKDFFRDKGCKFCVPEKKTRYWDYCGRY